MRKPEDRDLAVYNFTPTIVDYEDRVTKLTYQFADLDDLNTTNPLVRELMRKSYNHWIEQVGVDGFRIDTPNYVEHDFWHDFLHSKDPVAPGISVHAKTLGRDDFLTFGETYIQTNPLEDEGALEAASFLGTLDKPEMNSIINYPLFNSIQKVFSGPAPTRWLAYRLASLERIFPNPERLINLIDDHNGERFLTFGNRPSFRQALLLIMTIPGVPVIYYGTE